MRAFRGIFPSGGSSDGISAVLMLLTGFVALALAVGLYGITRDEDHELAMLALVCRAGEGLLNAIVPIVMLGLLWLARTTGANAPEHRCGSS